MRLALNGATIMSSRLARDVEIAAEAGFSALEVWAGKLGAYMAAYSLEDLRAALRDRGVQPWCINSIEDITFRDADGRRHMMSQLEQTCVVARAIGAPSIVVVPGRAPDAARRTDCVRESVDTLRAMSDVSAEISLAFEFLGKPGCAVPTLDMASEIIDAVDRPNVGFVIDTFHFYAGGSVTEDIGDAPINKLLVLHLNGCEDLPRGQLTDAHRLYPGEGAIPIDEILGAIRARGFDGVTSVEIFQPAYWKQDPLDVARVARAKAAAVLERTGFVIDPPPAPGTLA